MDNTDSNLRFYLAQLNEHQLLTRAQEEKLLHNIEARQTVILRECASSPLFRVELFNLLKNQNLDEIVKISRKLDDESTKGAIKEITTIFKKLLNQLESGEDVEGIQDSLSRVALSGTLVHTLVSQLKNKYSQVDEYEKAMRTFMAFFEVANEAELVALIDEIKSSEIAKTYYARKFEVAEPRLMARIYEYSELKNSLTALAQAGVRLDNFDEVKKLFKSITTAEAEMKRSRDELISKNLRLVVSRAKKFVNRGLDFEDLVQEGNIGLIKAVNKHDSSRGTKIATYATWWIDQTIRRAISNKSKTVRIPTHIEFLQTQLATIITKLTNELGRVPTKDEIAERAKVDASVLDRLEQIAIHKVGIEDEMSSGVSMLDILPSETTENPFNLAAKKLLRERIRTILGTLPPRTEKIVRLRFGIGEPYEEMTLQEIAGHVGLTKMGVRLVQNKGLEKIKKLTEIDGSEA